MRIEKYHAEDMQEAFRLIKSDLGPDAVVIQTRKVRLGLLGWLKHPVYEVVAAVDDDAKPAKFAASVSLAPPKAARPAGPVGSRESGVGSQAARAQTAPATVTAPVRAPQGASPLPTASAARGAGAYTSIPENPAAPRQAPAALAGGNGSSLAPAETPPTPDSRLLTPGEAGEQLNLQSSDITLLREMQGNMTELTTAMNRLSKQTQFGNIANFSTVLVNLYQRLVDQELAEDLAQDIVLRVNTELGSHGVGNYDLVREYVRKHVTELITVTGPPRLMSGKSKCIFLIGPTGVGKTTTLAKLAANYCLVEHKRVALVTVDTFRIAAIPQLRTYADIIGVPLEVVYTASELNEVLKRFADRDLILVDTPGGSPRNTKQLEVLKEYLDAVESKEVYLAVASPTKYRDMVEIFKRFSIASIDGLLFTKIDETDRFGPLVNLLNETKARLTYLTTGQNVPQDIELADSVKMAELLLTEKAES